MVLISNATLCIEESILSVDAVNSVSDSANTVIKSRLSVDMSAEHPDSRSFARCSSSITSYKVDEFLPDLNFEAFLEKAAAKERTTRQKKVEKHLKSMLKHSTFHGLQFCFKKENPLRRLIWILLIFLCVGLLVQKMFESTQHFLSHPFSTAKTVMMQTEVIFPAVSLCNLNDMRTSKMLGTKLHKFIENKDWNISGQLSGDEYRKTIRSANHRLDNMLFDCRIKGKKCTPKDFTLFYHNQGDKCYTFNSGEPGHELVRMNRIGPSHSLELTINIEYWDYYVDVLESGVHLILHGQEETPVRMQGIVASPGFITYVEIKKRKVDIPYLST